MMKLNELFPQELTDFAFLDFKNFEAMDAEQRIHELPSSYRSFVLGIDERNGRNVICLFVRFNVRNV
jgi:hypothetical protein